MKILILTDYSDNALKAFDYIHSLYPSTKHEFTLLNIQNARHAGSVFSIDVNDDMLAYSHGKMKSLVTKIKQRNPTKKINGLVTAGTFLDSVAEKANEFSIDLIVIGTKGAGGVKNVLLGSNTSSLIGHCTTPLLVIPQNAVLSSPNKALIAADFVKDPDPKTYDLLLDICYTNKTHLDLLHVVKSSGTHFDIKDIPFSTEAIHFNLNERENDNVEQAILDFIENNDIDLISLVKSKGGFIHDLFHSSLTKKLGMHANTPILVLV